MNKDDIIKKIKLLAIMTMFVLIFLFGFSFIYMGIPSAPVFKAKEKNEFSLSEENINYNGNNGLIVKGKDLVKLYDQKNNKVIELPIEEYIVGVLAGEMPANFSDEALKAQAVAARTYYFSMRQSPCRLAKEHGAEICNTTHCQVYMGKEERMSKWSASSADTNWNKIKGAVEATKGQVLVYEGELVENPKYFAVSAGKTENSIDVFSEDVPYLKSIDSPGEESAPKFESYVDIKKDEFIKTVNSFNKDAKLDNNNLSSINIVSRTEGEGVKEIKLGNISVDGVQFRKMFNLNSTDFNLEIMSDIIRIRCKGYGHRVGMSQWGANAMAKDGKSYDEILKHYYLGVEIEKVKFNDE